MTKRTWADVEADQARTARNDFLAKLIVGVIAVVIAFMALTTPHNCAPDDTEIECRNIP